LARLDESIAAFNQRFIFPLPFAMKIIKINLWNQGTRTSSQLHKSYKRTNYAKHTLSDKGVNIWNNLDSTHKNIKSYDTFKKKTKKYLLHSN
jgi:hypothetical protein